MSEILMDNWIGIEEAANYLGVTKETIRNWIKKTDIPAHKIGKLWKFKASELDAWIKSGKSAIMKISKTSMIKSITASLLSFCSGSVCRGNEICLTFIRVFAILGDQSPEGLKSTDSVRPRIPAWEKRARSSEKSARERRLRRHLTTIRIR